MKIIEQEGGKIDDSVEREVNCYCIRNGLIWNLFTANPITR